MGLRVSGRTDFVSKARVTNAGGSAPAEAASGPSRTRLLVSLASPFEIGPALAGGADVLDVKDPALGSLGAADPRLVAAARRRAPEDTPVTAALGDSLPRERTEAVAMVGQAKDLLRAGAELLKVGLAGGAGPISAEAGLRDLAAELEDGLGRAPRLVAVAFADDRSAGSIAPRTLIDLAVETGLAGAMLDTLGKGRSLLDILEEAELETWVREARRAGLVSGLAGSLPLAHLPRAAVLGPDVVGVRGAVCRGGRAGSLSEHLVRKAARAVRPGASRGVPSASQIA
jgi:uncharacterized protein (UPF0264 family)